jgi:hypothetical protein
MTISRDRHFSAFAGRVAAVLTLAGFAVALIPARAAAARKKHASGVADAVAACVDNYKTGLDNEQSGRLLQARELFIKCSKAACGSPLREECTTRFTQLSTDIPSVVPLVTDEGGGPQTDVEVRVDGERLTSSLDGHSLLLNPGVREFSFSQDGRVFATQKVMIVQGQRNRLIATSLQTTQSMAANRATKPKRAAPLQTLAASSSSDGASAPDDGTTPRRAVVLPREVAVAVDEQPGHQAPSLTLNDEEHVSTRRSTLSYVLGGAGLASLGAGALLIFWGRKDNNRLSDCTIPETANCPQSTVNHIHNLYLAGNIAVGVGVASVGAAYWAFVRSRQESSSPEEPTKDSHEEAYRFDVQPTTSGAVASIAGSF